MKLLILEEILYPPTGKWTSFPMLFILSAADDDKVNQLEQKLAKEFEKRGKSYKKAVKDKVEKPGFIRRAIAWVNKQIERLA